MSLQQSSKLPYAVVASGGSLAPLCYPNTQTLTLRYTKPPLNFQKLGLVLVCGRGYGVFWKNWGSQRISRG
ncbi:hypothetical protein AB1N83_007213 [Pleurotus pulmonarius]